MLHLTRAGLEAMGFSEIPPQTKIEATFSLVRGYKLDGLNLTGLPNGASQVLHHQFKEGAFVFGNSLNEMAKLLVNDTLHEDEAEWVKENKTSPPYLLVKIDDPNRYTREKGFWKKEKGSTQESIVTYDLFRQSKSFLIGKEERILPRLISGFVVSFSKIHQPIKFKPIYRDVVGKTSEGVYLYDVRFEMNGIISTAKNTSPNELKLKIDESVDLFSQLDQKVSFFLSQALEEGDRLKKYLNLFFVIEVLTHKVFKKIQYESHVNDINRIPDRIKLAGKRFFLDRQKESNNLAQRFIWCSLIAWPDIVDRDVEIFFEIKSARDKLAHGEKIKEADLPVEAAEALCIKLLGIK